MLLQISHLALEKSPLLIKIPHETMGVLRGKQVINQGLGLHNHILIG